MKENIGFIFHFLPSNISFASLMPWDLVHRYRNLFSRLFTCIHFFFIVMICPGHAQTDSAAMTHLLKQYVRIPSVHGREKEAGIFLATFAREKGLSVRVLTDTDSSFNLVISLYPLENRKPNILLISHMDVVDPGPETEWTYPPYSATITGDTIWGRGSLDNKSNTVMHLFALLQLARNKAFVDYRHNISLLVLSDEESGGRLGAQLVANRYLAPLNPVLAIGEGPQGINGIFPKYPHLFVHPIAVSNKNKVVLELEAHQPGSQLHASLSARHSSNNRLIDALYTLKNKKEKVDFNPTTLSMLRVFGNYETGIKRFILKHPRLFKFALVGELRRIQDLAPFFNNTHNITQIENPGLRSKNTIPSLSRASVDCRIQPHVLTGEYITRLIRRIDTSKVSIKESYTALENQSSPVNHPSYSIIVNTLEALYPSSVILPAQMPFSTDCQYFRAKGIPVYSFMPIQVPVDIPKSAHASNEHFLLSSLGQGQKAYVQILTALMTAQDAIAHQGKTDRSASKSKR